MSTFRSFVAGAVFVAAIVVSAMFVEGQQGGASGGTARLQRLTLAQIATPAAPTVSPQGATGATTYQYQISAINSIGETLTSSVGQTTTGNATLSGSNFNRVTWAGVNGAAAYKVYGRTSGSRLLMTTVAAIGPLRFDDTGAITPSGAQPSSNTTGGDLFATLDTESANLSLGTAEPQWINAGECDNATAHATWSFPTSAPAVPACVTGTNTQKLVLDFADGSDLSAQKELKLSGDFSGAIDATIYWYTTATTGSVVWQVQTICVADAETGDPTFNAASTVTDAANGTTNQYNTATLTGITATGCAAGEVLYLKIRRDSAHASDNLAATARFVGIELIRRRTR